jgi:hypothetical protein
MKRITVTAAIAALLGSLSVAAETESCTLD